MSASIAGNPSRLAKAFEIIARAPAMCYSGALGLIITGVRIANIFLGPDGTPTTINDLARGLTLRLSSNCIRVDGTPHATVAGCLQRLTSTWIIASRNRIPADAPSPLITAIACGAYLSNCKNVVSSPVIVSHTTSRAHRLVGGTESLTAALPQLQNISPISSSGACLPRSWGPDLYTFGSGMTATTA